MKHMIGIGWWGKPLMVEKTLVDMARNLDPTRASIVVLFDDYGPHQPLSMQSYDAFNNLAPVILKDFDWRGYTSTNEILECGCHNWLIDHFMKRKECDVLTCPQDDNRFLGNTYLDDLERVMAQYGDRIGYIGCRDGYNLRYSDFISSPWSNSDNARAKLPVGQFVERQMINPGPLVYTRSCVEKIGKLDPSYNAWYWWDDYALRAQHAGLVNGLLSTDLAHEKWGEIARSVIYQDFHGLVAKDLALLNQRWGPAHGGNVI
jgi:hypothetical protein